MFATIIRLTRLALLTSLAPNVFGMCKSFHTTEELRDLLYVLLLVAICTFPHNNSRWSYDIHTNYGQILFLVADVLCNCKGSTCLKYIAMSYKTFTLHGWI